MKRKPGILTIGISDVVLGWIGLNKAIYPGSDVLDINPVVGVRNQSIETLEAKLCGEPASDFVPPALAGNIGYMSADDSYHKFTFSPDDRANIRADELVDEVEKYGIPFIRRNANLATLIASMQTIRFANRNITSYRIPVGLLLLRRGGEAETFLKSELDRIGIRSDPAAQRYQIFATRLREQITQQSDRTHRSP